MPAPGPTRWLIFLVFGSLVALGCSTTAESGDASGTLALNLVLADGVDINRVSWEISGNDMEPMSGTIDTSDDNATASVEVFGLPGGEGYLVELSATSEDGEVSCEGSTEFGVVIGEATHVMVRLHCKLPVGVGDVRVNGKLNVCAELVKAVASPLQTSVGSEIDLSAAAKDFEGNDIEYAWTGTGGSIANPSAAVTTYTCEEVSNQTIAVTVSDDGFEHCMDDWAFQVSCYQAGLCDDVDCDDGNECTDNDCRPSTGRCINDTVENGTLCDGDAGSCWDGECVEIDRCDGVDCDDGNECTVDRCNPNDGSCSNTPVDDGISCDEGAGECVQGGCMIIDLCDDVECPSGNECVEDGTCDSNTGMCVDGANKPAGTQCSFGGVCDGAGTCKINTCATVDAVVVSPLQTSVGGQIALSAGASDVDGDPVAYLWTETGGTIAGPTQPSTTYTCDEAGPQTVTITVSDDDFEFCTDEQVVSVTCIGSD